MKTFYLLYSMMAICFILWSESGYGQKNIATFHTHPSECLGIEMDGSQTLYTWGTGRNRFDAVEQAKKIAVRDVLFNGITEGKQECQVKPVLSEVNVLEKNQEYFDHFFSDDGEYLQFISLADEKIKHKILRDKQKARNQVTRSAIVRVDRPGLIRKMKNDGILK